MRVLSFPSRKLRERMKPMIPIIDRINELAKKSKEVGLTEDERTEQSKLRQDI